MLLDSNIIIGFSSLDNESILNPFEKEELFASVISKIEVFGFHNLRLEDEAKFEKIFEKINLLELDFTIVEKAIELRKRKNISLGDAIIASTALIHDLPLVTANVTDFKWIKELKLINPFG